MLYVVGLLTNKDIDKSTLDTTINNLRARRQHMDRQQDDDYKRELKKLYKKISAKNRVRTNTTVPSKSLEQNENIF